jgi:hypothetical protein
MANNKSTTSAPGAGEAEATRSTDAATTSAPGAGDAEATRSTDAATSASGAGKFHEDFSRFLEKFLNFLPPEWKAREPFPPELERRLLRRFSGWLAGTSLVFLAGAGLAGYLVQKSVVEAADNHATQLTLDQLTKIRTEITEIENRMNDLLLRSSTNAADVSEKSAATKLLATEAQENATESKKQLEAIKKLANDNAEYLKTLSSGNTIDNAISKPEFQNAIAAKVTPLLQNATDKKINAFTQAVNVNDQLKRLNTESINGYGFSNSSTPTGAGFSPDQSPGRCPIGAYVVGIQPLPIGAGGGGIRFVCAPLPSLAVPVH